MEAFHLKFELSRRELWQVELRLLANPMMVLPVGMVILGATTVVATVLAARWIACVVAALATAVGTGWASMYFRGFIRAVARPKTAHDIAVEDNGIGVWSGNDRWWLGNDGFVCVEEFRPGLLTLIHYNGSYLHIPKRILTEEQVAFLRALPQRHTESLRALVMKKNPTEE